MNKVNVTDEEVIAASNKCVSASEAARYLGIGLSTYKRMATRLGVYKTNQGLKGASKPRDSTYKSYNSFNTMTQECAYWLGYIAADGSIVDNSLKFHIQKADMEQLERFLRFIKSDYPIGECLSHYKDKESNIHYFESVYTKITNTEIIKSLNGYGIVQGKKYKDIDFLSYIPDEYKIDFIIGFFDGDGGVSSGDNYRSIIIAANEKLSVSICNVFNTLGINYNIQNRNNIRVIYINADGRRKFTQIYYLKFRQYGTMARKMIKLKELYGL